MRSSLSAAIATLLVAAGLALSGCSSSGNDAATPTSDPDHSDIVVIQDEQIEDGQKVSILKLCDGSTLIYHVTAGGGYGGAAAVPNSPECGAVATPAEEPPPAK